MREARLLPNTIQRYRCLSKIHPSSAPLPPEAKAHLVERLLTGGELFQIRLYAFCVYNDYFDILIEVPKRPKRRSRSALFETLLAFQSEKFKQRHMEAISKPSAERYLDAQYKKWACLAGNPSEYMKSVKQGFSYWLKEETGKMHPVWKDRYKMMSVDRDATLLVELIAEIGASPLLIDSPLPNDYPYCSFNHFARNKEKQDSLAKTMRAPSWSICKARLKKLASAIPYLGIKRFPAHYGSTDPNKLRESNSHRLARLPTRKEKLAELKAKAKRYQELFRNHETECRDDHLACVAPDLLAWARKLRYRRHVGKVSQAYIDILDKHDFQWTGSSRLSNRSPWNQRFAEMKTHLAKKGSLPSTATPAPLSRWLQTQKSQFKKESLKPERAEKLKRLGLLP